MVVLMLHERDLRYLLLRIHPVGPDHLPQLNHLVFLQDIVNLVINYLHSGKRFLLGLFLSLVANLEWHDLR